MTMRIMEPKDVRAIVVHCTATPVGIPSIVEHVRRMHVVENQWDAIGYHFIIDRAGVRHGCRPMMFRGAHAVTANAHSLGIALEGGIDGEAKPVNNYTEEQFKTLYTLIRELRGKFPTILETFGHCDLQRDAGFKSCPCFDVRAWLTKEDQKWWSRQLRLA